MPLKILLLALYTLLVGLLFKHVPAVFNVDPLPPMQLLSVAFFGGAWLFVLAETLADFPRIFRLCCRVSKERRGA